MKSKEQKVMFGDYCLTIVMHFDNGNVVLDIKDENKNISAKTNFQIPFDVESENSDNETEKESTSDAKRRKKMLSSSKINNTTTTSILQNNSLPTTPVIMDIEEPKLKFEFYKFISEKEDDVSIVDKYCLYF